MEDEQFSIVKSLIDVASGAAGGTCNVLVGQPMDTVKVKMQTFPTVYRGMFHCMKETIASQGVLRGLYVGTTPNLVANISENAVLFFALGFTESAVARVLRVDDPKQMPVAAQAFSGSLAGVFSCLVLCPTELVKCKLQATREVALSKGLPPPTTGPLCVVRSILAEEGIRGMWRGLVPTWCRDVPGYFALFFGYRGMRSLLTPEGKNPDEHLGLLEQLFCGGCGGVFFWTTVFPIDVVKSRVQVHGSNENMLKIAFNIVRYEGVRFLYKGLAPTLTRIFPSSASLLCAYEYTNSFLSKHLL